MASSYPKSIPMGSPPKRACKSADVILEAGGHAVNKPADVGAALAEAKKDNRKAVLLRVKGPMAPISSRSRSTRLPGASRPRGFTGWYRAPPLRHRPQEATGRKATSGLLLCRGMSYMPDMRILIVEDDFEAANYMVKAFREAGHVADNVGDGLEGYARARDETYDVLIVDRMLPKLDGLSLIGNLRAQKSDTRAYPFRAWTGRRSRQGAARGRRRLSRQALRIFRASGAGRGAGAAKPAGSGRGNSLSREWPGTRPSRPQAYARRQGNSSCSRANSACSNI